MTTNKQAAAGAAPTLQLLRDFAMQNGCDEYTKDGKRIKLLCDYIWLRRMAPELAFETFLERYAPVADYNDDNRKHPEDAIKFHCPRAKSVADKLGKPQWNANETVDMLVLYVDMCRAAEAAGVSVPMELDAYLEMDAQGYREGSVQPPARPAARRATRVTRSADPTPADPVTGLPSSGVPMRPATVGQRVIYASAVEGGRQIKGVVEAFTEHDGRGYVTFKSDEGELIADANINHFTVCDEPVPSRSPPLETKRLWIAKSSWPSVQQALALPQAMANVPLGDAIHRWEVKFDRGYTADLAVVNGKQGPYVDAVLFPPESRAKPAPPAVEAPPRRSLLGEWRFSTVDGDFLLEVKARE